MLREWNMLQEAFGWLFDTLMDTDPPSLSRAVWNSVGNDRAQRGLVRAAAADLFNPPTDLVHRAQPSDSPERRAFKLKIWKELVWLLDSSDVLGSGRDAAAHSPVAMVVGDNAHFVPHDFWGNPLAKKFSGKKLLAEFALYRERASILRGHVAAMDRFIREGQQGTFPERPVWPESLPQNQLAVPEPQTVHVTIRRRQRRSSPVSPQKAK